MKPFYEKRLRALRQLKGKVCPGESVCLNDKEKGEIAGPFGRAQKRTLENFCHDQTATPFNALHAGCLLYPTKPENTPPSLYAAIDTAEELRELKDLNLLPSINELTSWEVCAYRVAESASRLIEAEEIQKSNKEQNKQTIGNGKTEFTSKGKLGQVEKGGAFDNWD